VLVPNGVASEQFRPMQPAKAANKVGLPPRTWIGYFGSMEPDRGVADLVQAVEILRAKSSNVGLLVCGRADASTSLERPWIVYRGQVPHGEIPYHMNACAVVALPYRRSAMMDAGASCKIAEYLLCELPIAATDTPNLVDNFPQQAHQLAGRLARPADPVSLAAVLELQLADPLIVAPPLDMTWQRIAGDLEAKLLALVGATAKDGAAR
jgi:glycosyltransferase involved in cell wall biosynthesis